MRVLSILFISIFQLFAIDATMEVIKKFNNIPSITIEADNSLATGKINKKLHKLIVGDLKVSCHFKVFDKYKIVDFNKNPKLKDYSSHKIDMLLKIKAFIKKNGNLVVDTKFYDINLNKNIYQQTYTSTSIDKYPFLAHKIAIDINKYLNAPTIEWMEKFIIFSKYTKAKQSEIVISDYTLTYQKTIIKNGLNLFPKWANKKQTEFYYTVYLDRPTLFLVNIYNGTRKKITESDGMLVCSDVSEDGSKLLLTMSPNGQPDIYIYDKKTGVKNKITKYSGIDVSASFIDKEKRIVFISNRLGYPNIFAKSIPDKNGKIAKGGVEQLVYHGGNNNSCSAFNNYIVYTSRESENEFGDNLFNLYLISTQSDYIRRLTTIGVNQFPKFSEDGESIIHINRYKKESALGIIRFNYNKSFLFPLNVGRIQSIDW